MRNGVCYISKRHNKAKNKYLKFYNPNEISKYVIYSEPNKLYGYAMSNFLPTDGFKWIDPETFEIDIAVQVGKVVF